ncbi:MAG: hypothetical protein D6718_09870 [Acidobacteria bacterium]|nr:MAG: hypothetical protein D6718_09870 [Acidobacteriota bacterium]
MYGRRRPSRRNLALVALVGAAPLGIACLATATALSSGDPLASIVVGGGGLLAAVAAGRWGLAEWRRSRRR